MTSLATLLTEHPAVDADPLIHTLGAVITAGEARARAGAVGSTLRSIGVSSGMAVAVSLPDGPDFVTAMFGVWLADAVFVPVDARVPAGERDRIVAELRCWRDQPAGHSDMAVCMAPSRSGRRQSPAATCSGCPR